MGNVTRLADNWIDRRNHTIVTSTGWKRDCNMTLDLGNEMWRTMAIEDGVLYLSWLIKIPSKLKGRNANEDICS